MQTQSSILILSKAKFDASQVGADVCSDIQLAKQFTKKNKYSLVILDLATADHGKILNFLGEIQKNESKPLIIIIRNNTDIQNAQKIANSIPIFKLKNELDIHSLIYDIQEALAEQDLKKQNLDLIKIIQEQNHKLLELNQDLESKVQARTLSLQKAKEDLTQANRYLQTFILGLSIIQKSNSLLELEKGLFKALAEPLNVSWIRIFLESSSSFPDQKKRLQASQSIYSKKIKLKNEKLCELVLARPNKILFSKEEKRILNQIANALALSVERLLNNQKADSIREQWQSTFDAIQDPMLIVNSEYEVLQYNKSFSEKISKTEGSKCYKLFFDRNSPCENCKLGTFFSLPPQKTSYKRNEYEFNVESLILNEESKNTVFVNHYQDKTLAKKAERILLETSKFSNLGLIGSSIAHEINNPLAGLITFIQILKEDLKSEKNSQLITDISEMEKSALKCKETVQNLLNFVRNSESEKKKIHLSDVVNKALRILSVKTKALGIEIQFFNYTQKDVIYGVENALSQSLVNIIQNSIDSVLEKKMKNKSFQPWIEVELSELNNELFLDIKDNGLGIGKNNQLQIFTPFFSTKNSEQHRGLGLTVAYQIVREHEGMLDLTTLSENCTRARVSFQRLDFT